LKHKIISIFLILFLLISFNDFSVIGDIDNKNINILWWYDLDAPSFGSAAVDDFDHDGFYEITFGTYFNDEHVYALNGENGSLLWRYNTGGCNDASPAIFDVDLDGELEVIIPASSPYRIYCFDGDSGNIEWSTSTGYPNCIDSPPAIADVDNDNKPEIIFGTFYGYVFCLNGEDGSIFWQTNLGSDSYIQSGPNILDVNMDGQLDIVVAQFDGDCRLYVLKGNDASILWYSDIPQDYMYHGGSFADIDEDGKPEIVIGCYDNHVYVYNGEDGSLEWEYEAPYYIAAPTSIADLNNDNHFEIVFVSYNLVGVLSHEGNLLWSYSSGGSIFRGVSIADVDDNGILDVVFGSDDGILRALKGNDGQIVWTYDLESHYGDTFNIDHAPVIADLNNNGELDVFVVGGFGTSSPSSNNHGRAYVLTAGGGTGSGWKMFRHDIKHSACFGEENNSLPIAFFSWYPLRPCIDNPIIFNASDSYDPDGNIISYEWDWNNDNIYDEELNIPIVSHNWSNPGTYIINLRVTDNNWVKSSINKTINISLKNHPQAEFFFSPKDPYTSDIVEFVDDSSDEDGDILIWNWDFGDGNISYQRITSHRYKDDGEYLINLTIIDDSNLSDYVIKPIFVKNVPPIPIIFSIEPNPAYYNSIVRFIGDGEDSDGKITHYAWESNIDGKLYAGHNASFTKDDLSIGIHKISLIVRDNDLVWSEPINETLIIREQSENSPPNPPEISGPISGEAGLSYDYIFKSDDPDFDSVQIFIDWDDNTNEWTGYNSSGYVFTRNHSWDKKDTFNIKAKSKDSKGAESDWSYHEIIIPKNKYLNLINWFFNWLFQKFQLIKLFL
jgi:outer membrane protein assembly factor BamB